MKRLFSILCFGIACGALPAWASSTRPVTTGATSEMTAFIHAAAAVAKDSANEGSVSNAYQVTKITPARKEGESDRDMYIRVLKSVLHRDFPITGDEEGYSFETLSGDPAEAFGQDLEQVEMTKPMYSALKAAIKKGLIVLSGNGSGNNTFADIFAVLDPANKEIAYYIYSNFGSDS